MPRQSELHTLPFSHFCEIARWSLQLAGESFQEKGYLPGLHNLSPAASYRKKANAGSTGKGGSLPFYAPADGSAKMDDSWQILGKYWGSVPPEVAELLNEKVGPQVRTIVYRYFLSPQMAGQWRKCGLEALVPGWHKCAWRFASPKIGKVMWGMMVKNEEFVQRSQEELDQALDRIEELLKQPDGPFQARPDGLPSPSGLALAALLGPLVAAEGYSGGVCDPVSIVGGLEALPEELQGRVQRCRARPAGQFVLETYRQRMRFPAAKL